MRIRSWNYSSMEPLYRGPLGVVSKARCETKGGRFDAVTSLDERLDLETTIQALDARMVRVGGLRSPLLVRDKGLVEVDGRICLASVLVDGVPLRYIVGHTPLPPRVACGLASKIAHALHTAYDRLPRRKRRPYGLVHGDLGPDDIIVGENGDIRVANVGWKHGAPALQPDPLRMLLPHPTAWAAPEAGDGTATHASDIYSLMALLSWMITAKVPSYASSEASWHEAVVEEVSGSVLASSGEVALGELIAWGMSHDPSARPRGEEVYGWLAKLTRTLPGAQWPAVVASRLGSAQADAIEAVVGLEDDSEDLLAAPPPEGLDWSGSAAEAPTDAPPSVAWDPPSDPYAEHRTTPRAHVASVVVDSHRRSVDLSAVLPRVADGTSASEAEEMLTEAIEAADVEFEDLDEAALEAPEVFQGLAEVSREADADAGFALKLGELESDEFEITDTEDGSAFTLEAGELVEDEDEDHLVVTGDAPADSGSDGGTIRIQVGGGLGQSTWGRDDLSDVELPEHLFREDDGAERSTRAPRQKPRQPVRITMPVHEDSLDVFAFQGSETDAIEATTGRVRSHLPLLEEDQGGSAPADEELEVELPPPTDALVMPVAPSIVPSRPPRPALPSYENPRPPRDPGGNTFLWAVGLASGLILAIMAANPLIQSIRNPVRNLPASPSNYVPSGDIGSSIEDGLQGAKAVGEGESEPVDARSAAKRPEATPEAAAPGLEPEPEPEPEPTPVPVPPSDDLPPPDPVPVPAPTPAPESPSASEESTAGPTPVPAAPPQRVESEPPPPPPPPPPPAPEAAAEAPAAADAGRGTVVLQGDAATVRLVGPGGTFRAGSVPVGSYTVQAVFDAGTPVVSSGDVVVKEGETVTVFCNSAFMVCKVR
ncbi:MAG TPA: hypothetical protein DFR83_25165 [Deltaproteobacteria bacterium]|nr:hypothetical protein [Deltaproteobacteria bacterium]